MRHLNLSTLVLFCRGDGVVVCRLTFWHTASAAICCRTSGGLCPPVDVLLVPWEIIKVLTNTAVMSLYVIETTGEVLLSFLQWSEKTNPCLLPGFDIGDKSGMSLPTNLAGPAFGTKRNYFWWWFSLFFNCAELAVCWLQNAAVVHRGR